jgi:hypothetical protein
MYSVFHAMEKKEQHNNFWLIVKIYFGVIFLFYIFIKDWLATQTIAVALTGGVVIWYTIETQLLRKETQKQTEIQIRPLVIIEITDRTFFLKNLGFGPALNVQIRPIQVSSEADIIIKFEKMIPILLQNEPVESKPEGFREGKSSGDFFTAHLDPNYADRNLSILIDYQNIDLKSYTTTIRVSPIKWKIVEFKY